VPFVPFGVPFGNATGSDGLPDSAGPPQNSTQSVTSSTSGDSTGLPMNSAQSVTPSAVGDPHLQNMYGQRFDLMSPGRHVLVHIPKGADAKGTLFRVEADARQTGHKCADIYFQELNLTGFWVKFRRAGGIVFSADEAEGKHGSSWMSFGKVDLKVTHGHTQEGLRYLNVYVKHLGRAGMPVGGLLGEDDHAEGETPLPDCGNSISLHHLHGSKKTPLQNGTDMLSRPRGVSVAEASLA